MTSDSRSIFSRGSMPLIRQDEVGECGLACLAMVLTAFGQDIDLRTLRRKYPSSTRGITLYDLLNLAERLGASARAVNVSPKDIRLLRLPAILHWDSNHFVVLSKIHRRSFTVYDPGRGIVRVPATDLDKHFSGLAAEIEPGLDTERFAKTERLRIFDLFRGASGVKKGFTHLAAVLLGLQVTQILSPLLLQVAVDEALAVADVPFLLLVSLILGMFAVLRAILFAAHGWAGVYLSAILNQFASRNIFRHLLMLPTAYFESRHIGDVQNRYSGLATIQSGLTRNLVDIVMDGGVTIAIGIVMLIYHAQLAAIVIIAVAIYLSIRLLVYKRLQAASMQFAVCQADEANAIIESLRSISALKVFTRTTHRTRHFDAFVARRMNAMARQARLSLISTTSNTLIVGLLHATVLFVALNAIIAGSFTLGMYVAFAMYQGVFVARAISFVDRWLELKLLAVPLERLSDIVLTEPETDRLSIESVPRDDLTTPLCISCSALTFAYPGSPMLFENFSFGAQPREWVAITGQSGAGKSTLIKVLSGLLTPFSGQVSIGGQVLTQTNRSELLQTVGIVLQEDVLLSGSIAENVAFFDDDIDMHKVTVACEIAEVNADIIQLPMGYETLVANMGGTFSTGQKQRLLLARALYRMPRLLVLDEATASLDIATEKRVLSNLRQLVGCTVVMVAHRPQCVQSADKIVRLDMATTPRGPVRRELPSPDAEASSG